MCREQGVRSARFERREAELGGPDVSDGRHWGAVDPSPMAPRRTGLEEENAKPKKRLAERMRDDAILTDVAAPTW
jgi:hypothetical protein